MAEVLAITVRESETIEGIKVSGRQIKISLFADDMTIKRGFGGILA